MSTSWHLKGVGAAVPRKKHVTLLGKAYVVTVPGSALASRALANTSETASVDPGLNVDNGSVNEAASPSDPANQHRDLGKPPIEFVTVPKDYKTENVREEPPLDCLTEHSPRITSRVARGHGALSRSRSSLGRSLSGSERVPDTPRSERSALSVRETAVSNAGEEVHSHRSLKIGSRAMSPSLAERCDRSLERHGELSIGELSLGEGRNIGGFSRRTDVTSAQLRAQPDTRALNYSPDDTDSGVEMYHETTSASPGLHSRRSSRSVSEGWISELDDSDGMSHEYSRSKHRNKDHHSKSFSDSRSQSGSARYSPSSPTHSNNTGQYSPNNTLRKSVSNKQFLDNSPSGKTRHHGDYYEHRGNVPPNSGNFSGRRRSSSRKRRDESNSKVALLLGNHGTQKKGNQRTSGDMDDMVALDSLTPQEAIAVFHDDVARMMDEEGEECMEARDVLEFLDGYMRLRSPFYLSMVDKFFRAVCVDCYKRPVEPPVDGRSGSSFRSLRSDLQQLHHFHNINMRM